MPYLTNNTETVKLKSNPEYWVKVQTSLSWGEMKKISTIADDGTSVYQIDAMLLACLKDWNLDDEDGNKLEINAESIDLLKKPDIEEIVMILGAKIEEPKPAKKDS